jgi:hypothetical protein
VDKTNAADFTKLIDGDDGNVHDNSKTRIIGDDDDSDTSSDEESSEETESENSSQQQIQNSRGKRQEINMKTT